MIITKNPDPSSKTTTWLWRCEACLSVGVKKRGTVTGGYWEARTKAGKRLSRHHKRCPNYDRFYHPPRVKLAKKKLKKKLRRKKRNV